VHHGVNPEYQDKNYAGMLIIWDRLFGTFEPERAEPVYGLTKPLVSWNPVWANLHVFAEIGAKWRASRTLRDRWRALFGHPGWRPATLGPHVVPAQVSPATFRKYEPPVPRRLVTYSVVQFIVVLIGSMVFLTAASSLSRLHLLAGTFYVFLSLGNIGGILESRAWAGPSETSRVAILGVVATLLLADGAASPWILAPAIGLALVSLVWFRRIRPLLTSPDTRAVMAM
jgi:hypothetical protein